MKKTSKLLLYILLIALMYNCDDDPDNGMNTPTAIVYVKYYDSGKRAPTWELVDVPRIYVNGCISGNPLPAVNYVKIAGESFSDASLFSYDQGEIYFSSNTSIWEDYVSEPKFDPLTVTINTSVGEISGSITVPDTIKEVIIDASDTIDLGTSLTISWSGSSADYYLVEYYHNWMEQEYYWLGYSRDTVVPGNSLVIDGSKLSKDGDLSGFEITPINGPMPEKNSVANMTGDGFGYLYLQNSTISLDDTIAIGNGIDYEFWEQFSKEKSSMNIDSDLTIDKIVNLLQLKN